MISPWNVSCLTKISSFFSRHPPTQIALKKTRSYYPRVVPPNRLGYPISCEICLRFPIPFFTCQNQRGGSISMNLNHMAGGGLFQAFFPKIKSRKCKKHPKNMKIYIYMYLMCCRISSASSVARSSIIKISRFQNTPKNVDQRKQVSNIAMASKHMIFIICPTCNLFLI